MSFAIVPRLSAAASAVDPLRQRLPPPDSLAFYVVAAALGLAEVIEWPAVLVAVTARAISTAVSTSISTGPSNRRSPGLCRRDQGGHGL